MPREEAVDSDMVAGNRTTSNDGIEARDRRRLYFLVLVLVLLLPLILGAAPRFVQVESLIDLSVGVAG